MTETIQSNDISTLTDAVKYNELNEEECRSIIEYKVRLNVIE